MVREGVREVRWEEREERVVGGRLERKRDRALRARVVGEERIWEWIFLMPFRGGVVGGDEGGGADGSGGGGCGVVISVVDEGGRAGGSDWRDSGVSEMDCSGVLEVDCSGISSQVVSCSAAS